MHSIFAYLIHNDESKESRSCDWPGREACSAFQAYVCHTPPRWFHSHFRLCSHGWYSHRHYSPDASLFYNCLIPCGNKSASLYQRPREHRQHREFLNTFTCMAQTCGVSWCCYRNNGCGLTKKWHITILWVMMLHVFDVTSFLPLFQSSEWKHVNTWIACAPFRHGVFKVRSCTSWSLDIRCAEKAEKLHIPTVRNPASALQCRWTNVPNIKTNPERPKNCPNYPEKLNWKLSEETVSICFSNIFRLAIG